MLSTAIQPGEAFDDSTTVENFHYVGMDARSYFVTHQI